MKLNRFFLFSILSIMILSSIALAHSDEPEDSAEKALVDFFHDTATNSVLIAAVIVVVLTLVSVYLKTKSEALKMILFLGIAIPSVLATVYVAGTTIYLNIVSATGGPVHWHNDFEIWVCGERIDLEDPTGLLNRIGTPKFHEHNDDRVHVEGTIHDLADIDLDTFFEVVGGRIEKDYMAIPTNEGLIEVNNQMDCNGEDAELQVFLWRVNNPNAYSRSGFTYSQSKLEDFTNYLLAPYINVPPGDCVIIEFGPTKDSTENLCASYEVAEGRGDLTRE